MILRLLLTLGSTAPQSHAVEIRGMEFHPAVLTARVGDTIVWINRDMVPHTATAGGRGGGRSGWDTGQLLQNQTGRIVVTRSGETRYVCSFHPTMRGKLIVR